MCASCATHYNNLSSGNPDLRPQHAWNYDLLGEHYFPAAGVVSGGVFYKQISDFIYLQNFTYSGPVSDFQGDYGRRPLGPVSARASYQYQGASIYSYGDGTRTASGDTYFYPHGQVDASTIANVTWLVSLQLQGLNLNNAIFGFYQGAPGATYSIQRETYGRSFVLGVKYGFGR